MSKFTNTLTENEKIEILSRVADGILNQVTLGEITQFFEENYPKEDFERMKMFIQCAYDTYFKLNLSEDEEKKLIEDIGLRKKKVN